MPRNRTKKKRKTIRFSVKMKRKLILVFAIVVIALIALIGRLTYISTTNNDEYSRRVLSQQGYDSKIIPYQRGDITDCNGTVLATSRKVYNLVFDCKVLNTDTKAQEDTIMALTSCFDLSAKDLRQLLVDYPTSQYKVLLKKLSYEEIQEFLEMQNAIENVNYKYNINGVWFEPLYLRSYPYGSLASNVIGFAASDGSGINGLELYYDDELTGVNGREYGYLNSDSNLESTTIPAEDGNTIQTTIDANIQGIVEKIVQDFNEEYRDNYTEGAGSAHTAILVMDPNTGAILADAQYPYYDLNNPRDLTAYYTLEQIDGMTEEEQYEALNAIWQNYAVTNTFEPGSTAKPFTVAAGLESGSIRTTDGFECDGSEQVDSKYTIKCTHIHGWITLGEAVAYSCNDALMAIANRIGRETFVKYQRIFGFGLKTNIDIVGEPRTDSLVYTVDEMNASSLATNSFGQNFNVTMVQLASGFCSLINGGNLYRPYFVEKIIDENGNAVSETKPTLLKKTISEETSAIIRDYLRLTVTDGTGFRAAVDGYEIGGKTGTAEKLPRSAEKYLVSFIGCAPIDDPQVVVYIVVDEVNAEDQAQSAIPTALAHRVFEGILPYMNIFPNPEVEAAQMEAAANKTDEEKNGEDYSGIGSLLSDENGMMPTQSGSAEEDNDAQEAQQDYYYSDLDSDSGSDSVNSDESTANTPAANTPEANTNETNTPETNTSETNNQTDPATNNDSPSQGADVPQDIVSDLPDNTQGVDMGTLPM